jgi:Na+-transporting methylmalonyl-CoA/oxaloacetate decarboxylase gamma subunit
MIKFLVTAAIVLICLFILVLVSCLMVWVVTRLLRWLFPQRFGGKAAPMKKPKKVKKVITEDEDEEA